MRFISKKINSLKREEKRIGCLGLSADPPHWGHWEITQLLLKENFLSEVWLIPCFEHSLGKSLSLPEHRLEMAKLLTGPKIKVSDVEFSRKGKSYTIDTVKILKTKYPSYQFFWIIGSDIIKTKSYKRWKNWQSLKSLINFLVIPRVGFEVEKIPKDFILVKIKISDISSSEVRERIRHGLSIQGLVPPKVKEYIIKHNLYQN